MQEIFETVGIEKPDCEAGGDPGIGMRKKMERNKHKGGAGQRCGNEIISFGAQALGFPLGADQLVGIHNDLKLARSLNRRKLRLGFSSTGTPACVVFSNF